MAMDLMMGGYTNVSFTSKAKEHVVQEAAYGLDSVEKLISLLSHTRQPYHYSLNANPILNPSNWEIEKDYRVVTNIHHCLCLHHVLTNPTPPNDIVGIDLVIVIEVWDT